ncbi:MAG: hypothetical protein JW809_14985 [Pirellulales bacterium]|nr:hypothetical protein [Pirellulales bacterium]
MATVGNLVAYVTANSSRLGPDLAQAKGKIGSFANWTDKTFGKIPLFGGPAGLAVGALGALGLREVAADFQGVGEKIDAMAKSARRLGVSVQEINRMHYWANLAGVSVGTLEKGLQKLNIAVWEKGLGKGAGGEALAELEGISGKSIRTLYDFADALRALQNPADRLHFVSEILGSKNTQLVSILERGSASLREQNAELDRMSRLSDAAAHSVEALHRAQMKLGMAKGGFKETAYIGYAYLSRPIFENLNRAVSGVIGGDLGPAFKMLLSGDFGYAEELVRELNEVPGANEKIEQSILRARDAEDKRTAAIKKTVDALDDMLAKSEEQQLIKAGKTTELRLALEKQRDKLPADEFKKLWDRLLASEQAGRAADDKEAADKLRDQLSDRLQALETRAIEAVANQGLSPEEAELHQLERMIREGSVKGLDTLLAVTQKRVREAKETAQVERQMDAAAKAQEQLQEKFSNLTERNMTPREKYLAAMRELGGDLGQGLPAETALREADRIGKELLEAESPKDRDARLAEALERGSAEEIAARNRAIYGGADPQRETRELLRQQVAHLQKLGTIDASLREIRDGKFPVLTGKGDAA